MQLQDADVMSLAVPDSVSCGADCACEPRVIVKRPRIDAPTRAFHRLGHGQPAGNPFRQVEDGNIQCLVAHRPLNPDGHALWRDKLERQVFACRGRHDWPSARLVQAPSQRWLAETRFLYAVGSLGSVRLPWSSRSSGWNVTWISKVAPADALDTITPASAVSVTLNDAETSPIFHRSEHRMSFRLSAITFIPVAIAPRTSSMRSSNCSVRLDPKLISRPSTGTT